MYIKVNDYTAHHVMPYRFQSPWTGGVGLATQGYLYVGLTTRNRCLKMEGRAKKAVFSERRILDRSRRLVKVKMEVKSQAQRPSLLHGLHSMKVTVSPLGIGPSNRTASSVYHLSYRSRHSIE